MRSESQDVQWAELAARLVHRTELFIDGEFVPASTGETFPSVNPATGATIADVARGTAADVDLAVNAARRAFESGVWSQAAPEERKQAMLRLVDLIREHSDELALLESLNVGKLVTDALAHDVPGAAAVFQWYAEAADKLYGEIAPTGPDELALVTAEPVGVVGAVIPWNFPLSMASWKLAPALVAGNSVVLKPAEQSPLSALRLAELASAAGIPDGVLNVVTGFGPEAGMALGLHGDVDCLAFTGSTEVGKRFLEFSARSNMKQVWLECGGKSANLVFADCEDLDAAADMAARGIFFNQGEVCSANSRLLVAESIAGEFVERMIDRAQALKPGDPLSPDSTLGAIVDEAQTTRVLQWIERGRAAGHVVTGGSQLSIGGSSCYIEPTVVTGLEPEHPVAQEEIFGPVLAVLPVSSEEEAIRVANGTRYGLAASVWTRDLKRAHRVARQLTAGTVSVNTVDAVSPKTPFGGRGESGFGRDLSLHAIAKYTSLKTTWLAL